MSNPQKENGYTAIANEIMEALAKTNISGEARRVLDVIFRKTYGFNKKEDAISLSQFMLSTSIMRPNVCRALKQLINRNIVIRIDNGYIIKYRINKNFDTWKSLSKLITPLSKPIISVIGTDNGVLSEPIHTKVDITKDNISMSANADVAKSKIKAEDVSSLTYSVSEEIQPRNDRDDLLSYIADNEAPKKRKIKNLRAPAPKVQKPPSEKIQFFAYFCQKLNLHKTTKAGQRYYCTTESALLRNTLVKQILGENTLEEAKKKVDWFVRRAEKNSWLSRNACLRVFIRELSNYEREVKPVSEIKPRDDNERADKEWIEEERKRIAAEEEKELEEYFSARK